MNKGKAALDNRQSREIRRGDAVCDEQASDNEAMKNEDSGVRSFGLVW